MSKKLLKSTFLVSVMTTVSRLFGFARDVVLANIFGAGGEFDAFVVAFKLPNFLRQLFAEGAFSQAFVPVLVERRNQDSPEELQEFVNRVAGSLMLAVSIAVALTEIFAPLTIMIFAPGFLNHTTQYHQTVHMLRITSPYLLLVSMVAFSGAILNTHHRFGIAAFTPIVLNIGLVIVAYCWAPHAAMPIYALAWGVLLSGVMQLLMQIPFLKQIHLLPKPKVGFNHPLVRRVMRLMVPALFGVSVAQLSLVIDNFFASFLPAGSISWLYYSDRLTYLPLGIVGVALSTVVLPNLAHYHAAKDNDTYSKTIDWALRIALLVGIPAGAALFILSGPLLATLIHHGAFNNYDVIMTRKSLMAFCLGLPAFMLIKILASAFYSRQNIKTPVKVAACAVMVNIAFNLILISSLKHAGLALSSTIAAYFNSGMLLFLLIRKGLFQKQPGWGYLALRLLFAAGVMSVVIIWWAGPLQQWLDWSLWHRALHLTMIIVVGIVLYCAALLLSGLRLVHLKPPV